jgi:hypothetical protein
VDEGLTLNKAWQTILVGVQGDVKGARISVDSQYKALLMQNMGGLEEDLVQAGLFKAFNSRKIDVLIEKELYHLDTPESGLTKSVQALEIAKILNRYNEDMRVRLNRAGANINKLDNFTITQTHDIIKMKRSNVDEWINTVLPILDIERTFKVYNGSMNEVQAREQLKQIYSDLIIGKAIKEEDGQLFHFKGPGNLAKRISQSRVLHFKTVDDAIKYREKFGRKDFIDGYYSGMERASRNLILLETFGTNPESMFNHMLEQSIRDSQSKVPGDAQQFFLKSFYREVSGQNHVPEIPNLAAVGSSIRAWNNITKMGQAAWSTVTDISSKAMELQYQGFGILESYYKSLSDLPTALIKKKEMQQVGRMLSVYAEGASGSVVSRWTGIESLPGSISKAQRLFFKLNLLSWITDSHKQGLAQAMSNHLADFKKLPFNKLDDDTTRIFKHYNINDKDWDIIRQAVYKFKENGREFIMPELIRELPDELFGRNPARYKDELELKLRSYFSDRVDYGVMTPGARERANILNLGTKAGTPAGEFLRIVAQFKSFSVGTISKTWGRSVYSKGYVDVPMLIQHAIITSAFGYLAMSGKDLNKGLEPRDPADWKTFVAAFIQGGGAGILGDYMFGEYSRFGRGFTETLMGPTFGTVDDFVKLLAASRNDIGRSLGLDVEQGDSGAKAIRFITNNIPGAGLFWLQPVLNYAIIYQLEEWANPGSLRRKERKKLKENNQRYFLPPSEVVK